MSKLKFGAEYMRIITRYNVLNNLSSRTWQEQQELDAINRVLEAQELGTVRAIVDDYEFAVGQAGDLGGTEIL